MLFDSRLHSLSNILEKVNSLPERELDDRQKKELASIRTGCNGVLGTLKSKLDKYKELELRNLDSNTDHVKAKIRNGWKRVRWDPEDAANLSRMIVTKISLLNSFHMELIRSVIHEHTVACCT
jgi:hypothetical protein